MKLLRPPLLSFLAAAFFGVVSGQAPGLSPSPIAASETDLAPQVKVAPSIKQSFALVPRGKAWQSNRPQVGTADLLATGSPRMLEFNLELSESSTHIQRTHRQSAAGPGTLVYREWRLTRGGGQAGRSLVLESLPPAGTPGESLLREWAGGAVRHESVTTPADGLTWLAWIEQEREHRSKLPMASDLSIFSDQECKWTRALVVRTSLGPAGILRIVDLLPMDGSRNSRLVFAGTRLLGFLEGDLEGVLISEVTRAATALGTGL
ncbi:MAG: hypothetical protein P8R48_02245 [Planctomycetota bacterium]|nr:hypothetical protein [Planctomycetota bacterium]